MDIARLILEYLGVLAWPVVLATFFLTFRRSIAGLIDRARNASALGVTAEFAGRIEDVIDEAPGLETAERESLKESVRAELPLGAPRWELLRSHTTAWKDVTDWARNQDAGLRNRQRDQD